MVETLNNLKVGVDFFDKQHDELANMLIFFREHLKKNSPKSCLLSMIGLMIEKAKVHLDMEEQLMFKLDFPRAEAHKIKHDQFLTHMSEFMLNYDRGLCDINLDQFFEDVHLLLKMHIKTFDTPYNSFLIENGYT